MTEEPNLMILTFAIAGVLLGVGCYAFSTAFALADGISRVMCVIVGIFFAVCAMVFCYISEIQNFVPGGSTDALALLVLCFLGFLFIKRPNFRPVLIC